MMRVGRLVGTVLALAGLTAAAVWSVRVGWADYESRKENVAGTEAALRWMPQRGEYYYRLALLTVETDPRRATAALRNAVALNPADSRSWIELGLRREADGDLREAEQCLLRAAAEDRP